MRVEVEQNVILHGDARRPSSYAQVLGDRRVALLHADPPYCLLVRRGKRGRLRDPKRSKLNHSAVNRYEDIAAYRSFTEAWLPPALASVRDDGHAIIWTNLLGRDVISETARAHGFVSHGEIKWAKLGRAGNIGEQVARMYEVALVFGRLPPAALDVSDISPPRHHISGYDDDQEAGVWGSHPNHKPFGLLEPIIRHYTRPGERILEPFSGSGSTAAAAVQLDRCVSAIELRQQWAETSVRRIQSLFSTTQS